jgi:hypothetical protein
MNTQQLRFQLERQKGQKVQIEKTIMELTEIISNEKRQLRRHEQAREIIREVGLKTQQQLQYNISEITSLALNAVFSDPYKLLVEFIQRRNKTECDLFFSRNENKIDPISSSGGGAIDVAAFALRIASWTIQTPKNRNVIIMDEPFKHLKGEEANLLVLDMVQEISKRLNIQIIMVSDERISRDDIKEKSDSLFEVSINKKVISKIKTI